MFFCLYMGAIFCSISCDYCIQYCGGLSIFDLSSTFVREYFLSLWGAYRIKKAKQQQKLNQLEIPIYIKTRFLEVYPEIDHAKIRIIEEGWKDFLALHLRRKTAYVMPSQAVDALWHLLVEEFNPYYQQTCQRILGYVLNHKEHNRKPTKQQRQLYQVQMMITWKEACLIEQRDPEKTSQLPRIFQIDQQLKWPAAQQYKVKGLQQAYTKWIKNKQNHSDASSSTLSFTESSVITNLSSSSISNWDVSHHNLSDSPISDSSSSCGSCSSSSD